MSSNVATPPSAATAHALAVRRRVMHVLRGYGIVLAFLLLVVIVGSASDVFFTGTNVSNLLSQWAPAGIMAIGMTFVILTAGFDLSIASGYALCAVTAAGLGRTHDPAIAFAAALGVGVLIGVINGALVAWARINPFIATVGTGFILSGVALVATHNTAYVVERAGFDVIGSGRLYGVPYSGMILVGLFVIGGIALARTVYGQAIYAVGGNEEASRLSGVRTALTVASAYVILGACVGIAGVLTASQLSSAQANINPTIVFDVLTVVVVGGTSLVGGVGSMWRTAIGLGILAVMANGFNLADIDANYQNIVKGTIIVAALALDVWSARRGRSVN